MRSSKRRGGGQNMSRNSARKKHLLPGCPGNLPGCFRIPGVFRKFSVSSKRCFRERRRQCVRNASKTRQKCAKMGLVLLGKEERSKMRQKCVKIASKMRQKCAEHLWGRTPFGRYRCLCKKTLASTETSEISNRLRLCFPRRHLALTAKLTDLLLFSHCS